MLLVARGEERLAAATEEAARAAEPAGGGAASLSLDVTAEDAGERMLAACEESFGSLDVLVNNAGAAKWRDLDDVPDEDWRAQYELNVMAPLRAMRAAIPPMAERGWGRVVNVCSTAGKRPSAAMAEYSVAKAAELSLSRLFADRYAKTGVLVNAVAPGPVEAEMWMEPGGLLDQSMRDDRRRQPRGGARRSRLQAPDRPARPARGDRRGDRLPLLRARLLRRRRGLVGGRRHRPGDHLIRPTVEAAVLLPLYGWPEDPGLIFTERRADLRRHAGEISFPGGRRDESDADLQTTALREAEEEIGLDPAQVKIGASLPATRTFVTNYVVHPFVGYIPHPRELSLEPNPSEVETVLTFSLELLREGYEMRRLIRRGVPIHTPTYEVEGQLIWGATARILSDLLDSLD